MKGDDDQFRLFVLPANRKVDSAALREKFGFKRLRFATAEELKAATGLGSGVSSPRSVARSCLSTSTSTPHSHRTTASPSTPGALTDSMIVPMADYLRVAAPTECFSFSVEPDR